MRLRLTRYTGDQWFLLGEQLAGDTGFVPHRPCFFELPDSERWEFNATVNELKVGSGIPLVFNQVQTEGLSGFELWTEDDDKVLALAEAVASRLGLELVID
ncbi:MAG: hypothetical protein K2X77_33690 [Candidatus Obscuribacterales bacterium]|jgi:hypothetical protein|nr:hypothetical protein [Candidatus Obscuribacterales bacterium]